MVPVRAPVLLEVRAPALDALEIAALVPPPTGLRAWKRERLRMRALLGEAEGREEARVVRRMRERSGVGRCMTINEIFGAVVALTFRRWLLMSNAMMRNEERGGSSYTRGYACSRLGQPD